MSIRAVLLSVISVLTLATASGCPLAAMKQQNDATQAYIAQGQANAIAAQANAHTDKFVVADHAWLCPTAQGALVGKCEGGTEVAKNRVVTVIGEAPKDGVWPASLWDRKGEHKLFVAAGSLNELPDTAALDGFADDVARRFPDAKRIPLGAINFADLIEQPAAYHGRYLVVRQPSGGMTNKDFGGGVFKFTIPIPVTTGSRWLALAQFEIKNTTLVGDFENGGRSYQCGPKYCDDFVIVAELTSRTIDRVDERGTVHRLPVFAIRELGDRYGTYRPQ
ncbi:MAG: hypothetical protein H6Q90_6167 [Deltaproteobacteria bacterium]|nr:hypothetical protein [Deltaproteobacteria bacterium]